MLVYRIAYIDYSKKLVPSGIEGRWNSRGKEIIYCAESIALSLLENMMRRQGAGFTEGFRIMVIEIPRSLKIQTINNYNLKEGWRGHRDYSACQLIGNTWYEKNQIPVLQVPSAVVTGAFNYLINTTHPDFKKVKQLKTTEL